MTRSTAWRLIAIFVAVFWTAVACTVTQAGASTVEITVPIDTVFTRADVREGDVRMVASRAVPDELVGQVCDVVAFADNGPSTHLGSHLIITSNGDRVVAPDVERAASARTPATGRLTLGATIDVAVQIGSDRQFSGGITVTVDCPPPTTTTEPETTTTWATSTTAGPTPSSGPTTSSPETTSPPSNVPTSSSAPPPTSTTTVSSTSTSVSTTAPSDSSSTTSTPSPSTSGSPRSSLPSTSTTATVGTEPPGSEPQLPRTGTSTTTLVAVGLALAAAGGSLVLIARGSA